MAEKQIKSAAYEKYLYVRKWRDAAVFCYLLHSILFRHALVQVVLHVIGKRHLIPGGFGFSLDRSRILAFDDKHVLPARLLRFIFCNRVAERRPDDLLMLLRKLPAERNAAVSAE